MIREIERQSKKGINKITTLNLFEHTYIHTHTRTHTKVVGVYLSISIYIAQRT